MIEKRMPNRMKTTIALVVLLGLSPALLEAAERGKAVHRRAGHAEIRSSRPTPPANRSNEAARPSVYPNRPAYAPSNECWNDDGGFRWRPCSGGDGGGGGGGGGGGM
jgi:hypothetical protein